MALNRFLLLLLSCRSTYMNRTLASARSFLAGLFSAENQVQAKGKRSCSTSPVDFFTRSILVSGPFEIEVHHFPDEDMVGNELMSADVWIDLFI